MTQMLALLYYCYTIKLWLYSTSLLRHFKSHDTNNTGVIHSSNFKVNNTVTGCNSVIT